MMKWGSGGITPPFFTSALDGSKWSASRSGCFTPGKRTRGAHWIGGCMGLRADLGALEQKSPASAGNLTLAVQLGALAISTEVSRRKENFVTI
jgi:hypothetical protein